MIKKIIAAFLLAFCVCTLQAQDHSKTQKFSKFGKVALNEFETKVSGADSASRGVKLFDVGKCYFQISSGTGNFEYVYERHVRYKVLTKSGYDLADFEIGLYRSDSKNQETMEGLEAATYNLDNGKISASKLLKDAKFSEKHDNNWTIKKFTLPNVKEGSIVEYRYTIKSSFLYNLRDWYFQSSIPTLYSEYAVKIPEYFRYKISPKGFFPIQQLKPEDINETFYIKDERNVPESVHATARAYKFIAEQVPAMKAEKFITTTEDYIAKVDFEINNIQFPGGMMTDYNSSWPKIVKQLMEDENFGRFFNRNSYVKALLPSIIKSETTPEAQALLIYNYVKNTLKWNELYSKYSSVNQIKNVFEKKSGNSADINLSLLSLLNEAKIDASPVLISTRENGQHPGHPILSKFNNVVVQIELGDKKILLDASDKYLTENLVDFQNLAYEGFKIDTKEINGAWISLEAVTPSRSNAFYHLKLAEDNKLTGMINLSFTQYDGLSQRNKFAAAINEAEFIKSYKADKPGLAIKSFKIENLDNPAEILTQSFTVEIEDNVEEAGNLVMLSPLFFHQTKDNPLAQEERQFPVDFAHPIEELTRVVIEFPANYKLEKLPVNGKLKLPNDDATFSYIFTTENNIISIASKISIIKPIFSAEEYHNLRELFRMIIEKQAQQIVFKKI